MSDAIGMWIILGGMIGFEIEGRRLEKLGVGGRVGPWNRTRCVGRAGVIGGDFAAAADMSGRKGDSGIGALDF